MSHKKDARFIWVKRYLQFLAIINDLFFTVSPTFDKIETLPRGAVVWLWNFLVIITCNFALKIRGQQWYKYLQNLAIIKDLLLTDIPYI